MQYLNTSEARYGSGTPWAPSPYAKPLPQRFWYSVQLLRKQFINENKARRLRKKGT